MKYGYIRVSTKNQKIDRQINEIKKFIDDKKLIYIDKESGKDFNRTKYQELVSKLKEGDLLIIKSIDRLGRNYQMIVDEWQKITKVIKADIYVIDMPILDTRTSPENLVGKVITDIVLQLLSYVAENERINIKERQAEGIIAAKLKGVKFGRPPVNLPKNNKNIFQDYINKTLKEEQAINKLGISRGTFYRRLKEYKLSSL